MSHTINLLIIGGGIQGLTLAGALSTIVGRVRIIDPHSDWLHEWRRNCAACGMRFLRSPGAHTIDTDFRSLVTFAQRRGGDPEHSFLSPYKRPSLALFMEHAAWTIATRRLDELRLQGRVEHIELHPDRVTVGYRAADGTVERLHAEKVMLAVGRAEWPLMPTWARGLPSTAHIYAPEFRRAQLTDSPVIIGGGISAIQLALSIMSAEQPINRSGTPAASAPATSTGLARPVRIITRHTIRTTHFDSDPGYIGPKYLPQFLANRDWAARRREIDRARASGSLSWELMHPLQEALRSGRIALVHGSVERALPNGDRSVELLLDGGQRIRASHIVLATGFAPDWSRAPLIATLARRYRLPIDSHGWPLPDRFLRWGKRLFVCGALAELELGPAAANIVGAHLALRRLVPLLQGRAEATIAQSVAWQALRLTQNP